MGNTIHQHGQGDNFAGDQVHGDKIHTQINNSTDLTEAARDIKALLTELDQQYDNTTADGQELIEAKAIKGFIDA